ncbi:hypothetical protein GCM10017557_15780 [Streptomyces aurantiacus]|uniref:Uncharacterized protein n=1 Tax=Streptomyces aurantiacus TaxID=47760 RepID=A0A7G1NV24_9ACTN|nr:hypothetical protein GCM10017557_15780 [Streptomyces aurantiacus]
MTVAGPLVGHVERGRCGPLVEARNAPWLYALAPSGQVVGAVATAVAFLARASPNMDFLRSAGGGCAVGGALWRRDCLRGGFHARGGRACA